MDDHTHRKSCATGAHKCSCKATLNHISRIEGQLRTLRSYVEQGRRCEDVALLSTSIAKSFDTLRVRTLRNFFINDVLGGMQLSAEDEARIDAILKLYKK